MKNTISIVCNPLACHIAPLQLTDMDAIYISPQNMGIIDLKVNDESYIQMVK